MRRQERRGASASLSRREGAALRRELRAGDSASPARGPQRPRRPGKGEPSPPQPAPLGDTGRWVLVSHGGGRGTGGCACGTPRPWPLPQGGHSGPSILGSVRERFVHPPLKGSPFWLAVTGHQEGSTQRGQSQTREPRVRPQALPLCWAGAGRLPAPPGPLCSVVLTPARLRPPPGPRGALKASVKRKSPPLTPFPPGTDPLSFPVPEDSSSCLYPLSPLSPAPSAAPTALPWFLCAHGWAPVGPGVRSLPPRGPRGRPGLDRHDPAS